MSGVMQGSKRAYGSGRTSVDGFFRDVMDVMAVAPCRSGHSRRSQVAVGLLHAGQPII